MRRISIWLAAVLVFTAIVVTFFTTTYLDRRFSAQQKDKLLEAANLISTSYVGNADRDAMTDAAISAMVDSLGDQWSYYLTVDDLAQYRNFENNRYQGLGLVVTGGEDGGVFIQSVYRQSPAGAAGIRPGGRIIGVNGADTLDASLTEAMELITKAIAEGLVELEIQDEGGQTQRFSLIPGDVKTDPVSSEMLAEDIGLIRISNFEDRSGSDSLNAIQELCEHGAKALIFDVRNNPGGQLQQLLMILDHLLPEGTLFISKDKQGRTETEISDEACLELPIAVLVNGDSYSAAEFFAAALQEYGWAEIVGEQTSGKGYAQVTLMLSDGSAVHLSTVEYFTPKGKSLAGIGITPDHIVELDPEQRRLLANGLLEHEADIQLETARSILLEELSDKP